MPCPPFPFCHPQGGLPLTQCLSILLQVMAAIMHLHENLGIIHRDIRAANVLVQSSDPLSVVLTDFGLSHRLSKFAPTSAGPDPTDSDTVGAPARFSTVGSIGSVLHGAMAAGPVLVSWIRSSIVSSFGLRVFIVH